MLQYQGLENDAAPAQENVGSTEPEPKLKTESLQNIKCVLLDIEGTTSPIDFVKKVLFPYARETIPSYIKSFWNKAAVNENKEFVALIKALHDQCEQDVLNDELSDVPKFTTATLSNENDELKTTPEEEISSLVSYIYFLMDADRKVTPLKELQGLVWRKGYETEELKGDLFEDVHRALKKWTENGIQVSIYSSGSVGAQKLLFQYSICGDLSSLLSNHFDTKIGTKQQTQSYRNILQELKMSETPEQVLFVTDILQEAQAANDAGISVALSVRTGNAPLPDEVSFQTIKSFDDLSLC